MDDHIMAAPLGEAGQDVARLYELLAQLGEVQDYRWAETQRRLTALEKGV